MHCQKFKKKKKTLENRTNPLAENFKKH